MVCMYLYCTTKIKDMKINFTVWLSKNRSALASVAELLKGKEFESWSDGDQRQMDKLLKHVHSHYHGSFEIKTDSATSTFLDMDELVLRDMPIAEGAAGRVYIGRYRSVEVAVKMFHWESLSGDEMEELKENVIRECELMAKLRNPFIVNYIGSVTYIPQVSLVMQYFVLGSLGEFIHLDRPGGMRLPYRLKLKILFDTARGMAFLHENKILHLDLKPDNILMNSLYDDSNCVCKITDFGTSRLVRSGQSDKGLGTTIYAAPEAHRDVYTFKSDVFSFAVTAWEVFYQTEPYKEARSLFEIKDMVIAGQRLALAEPVPKLLSDLIADCWKQEGADRPGFDTVSKRLTRILDDAENQSALDLGYDPAQIEAYVFARGAKMAEMMKDLVY